MPQFDIIVYFTFFITFLTYSFILYILFSIFIIPFFWNIYYFRYLKKENNNLLAYIYHLNKLYLNHMFMFNTIGIFKRFEVNASISNKILIKFFVKFNLFYKIFSYNYISNNFILDKQKENIKFGAGEFNDFLK